MNSTPLPPNLDPNPKNQLGKGVLPAALEAELLATGIVFAAMVVPKNPKVEPFMIYGARPLVDAATDAELDAMRLLRKRPPVASMVAPLEHIPAPTLPPVPATA